MCGDVYARVCVCVCACACVCACVCGFHLAFRRVYASRYVSSSKTMGQCKNPRGCDGILSLASELDETSVTCGKCAMSFCVSCDFPPHTPSPCSVMSEWHAKRGYVELSTDEMAALEAILTITKPCPKCGVRIQKNEGCMSLVYFKLSCI